MLYTCGSAVYIPPKWGFFESIKILLHTHGLHITSIYSLAQKIHKTKCNINDDVGGCTKCVCVCIHTYIYTTS